MEASIAELGGRAEGAARVYGSTMDEIETTAQRLSALFKKLGEQGESLKERGHIRVEPEFSQPWIKESLTAWENAQALDRTRANAEPTPLR